MKLPVRETVLVFLLAGVGTQSFGQSCDEVCTSLFWNTATPQEIATALQSIDVDARDEEGRTPLHWVGNAGTPEQIAALIEAGADVNARSLNGSTPLHFTRTPANIPVLVEAGADVDARDVDGAALLHFAASLELVSVLLEAGADANVRAFDGMTPLHFAAFGFGDPEMIFALLAAGADVNAENEAGMTPWNVVQLSEGLQNTPAYWAMNEARFR